MIVSAFPSVGDRAVIIPAEKVLELTTAQQATSITIPDAARYVYPGSRVVVYFGFSNGRTHGSDSTRYYARYVEIKDGEAFALFNFQWQNKSSNGTYIWQPGYRFSPVTYSKVGENLKISFGSGRYFSSINLKYVKLIVTDGELT